MHQGWSNFTTYVASVRYERTIIEMTERLINSWKLTPSTHYADRYPEEVKTGLIKALAAEIEVLLRKTSLVCDQPVNCLECANHLELATEFADDILNSKNIEFTFEP